MDNKTLQQQPSISDVQQLKIEVVYGTPERQELLTIMVDEGTTVEQAIGLSGIIEIFPEIDLSINKVGVWNRSAKLTDGVN